jgi:hypothetical protein
VRSDRSASGRRASPSWAPGDSGQQWKDGLGRLAAICRTMYTFRGAEPEKSQRRRLSVYGTGSIPGAERTTDEMISYPPFARTDSGDTLGGPS